MLRMQSSGWQMSVHLLVRGRRKGAAAYCKSEQGEQSAVLPAVLAILDNAAPAITSPRQNVAAFLCDR